MPNNICKLKTQSDHRNASTPPRAERLVLPRHPHLPQLWVAQINANFVENFVEFQHVTIDLPASKSRQLESTRLNSTEIQIVPPRDLIAQNIAVSGLSASKTHCQIIQSSLDSKS
jgi:hypothetical protein